jgi:hypothetical protein
MPLEIYKLCQLFRRAPDLNTKTRFVDTLGSVVVVVCTLYTTVQDLRNFLWNIHHSKIIYGKSSAEERCVLCGEKANKTRRVDRELALTS